MKIFKLALGMAAGLLLASCNINELPEYDDSNAFVAFTSTAVNVGEEAGSTEVEVLLTSIGGIETTVNFEVVPAETAGAVEGTHYTIEGSKTLKFTKDAPTQRIKLNIVDNETFDGNVKFNINLTDANGVQLGASKTCTVTIQDNEHPLLFILGTYVSKTPLVSAFSSRGQWDAHEITIERDPDDISKVWISNLEPYFATAGLKAPTYNYFYGIVNEEKTEIRIPCSQETGYVDSDGIGISLYGFEDPTADSEPMQSGNIIMKIQDDGKTLLIENAFGVCKTSDLQGGWYNIVLGPATFTKK